jgi:hypothetical protein
VCYVHGHPFQPVWVNYVFCTGWSIMELLPLEA